ncbi:uncharacterized protein DSM5745_08833 [Aspergillus mulundensis]|uniref:Uncharacterized protein n=1 Tax=Aspergillus mulundensis TaxID=1810919 RepID=A0A3D8R4U2_9EURO|nr:hypothetical protein DSM5745_08833 [Aspergillus mulundensis]RDW69073.1 hypothetical protein DSM5745_08833 [Aspergillus mulundensis]
MSQDRFTATFGTGLSMIMRQTQMFNLREAVRHFRIQEIQDLLRDPKCPVNRSVIEDAAVNYYNEVIFRLIAMALITRRQRLLVDCVYNLPPNEMEHVLRPIDTRAAWLGRQLLRNNVVDREVVAAAVPDLGSPDCDASVYFLVRCNRKAAETFYDLGYRRVDELRGMGCTPLAALEIPTTAGYHGEYSVVDRRDAMSQYLAMCAWYHERGASLYTDIGPLTLSTPLHRIARCIGRAFADLSVLHWQRRDGENEREWQRRISIHYHSIVRPLAASSSFTFLRALLFDVQHHEQYACPCSLNGPLPFDVLINETVHGDSSARRINFMASALLQSQGLWDRRVSELPRHIVSTVVRACTFACLDLRHSCGTPNPSSSRLIGERSTTDTGLDLAVSKLLVRAPNRDWRMVDCLEDYWMSSMEELQNLGAHTSTVTDHGQT